MLASESRESRSQQALRSIPPHLPHGDGRGRHRGWRPCVRRERGCAPAHLVPRRRDSRSFGSPRQEDRCRITPHTPAISSVRTVPASRSTSRTASLVVSAMYSRFPATRYSRPGVETRIEAAGDPGRRWHAPAVSQTPRRRSERTCGRPRGGRGGQQRGPRPCGKGHRAWRGGWRRAPSPCGG